MSRARTIFKSAIWNHAGRTLEFVFMYATSIALARGLSVAENGIFVSLLSVSHLLLVLSSFGLEAALNKHIPQLPATQADNQLRRILRVVLSIRGVLAIAAVGILYVAISLLPFSFSGYISAYFWPLAILSVARSFAALLAMVLTAQLKTTTTAAVTALTRGIEFTGVLVLAGNGLTIPTVLLFLAVTSIIQMLWYLVLLRRELLGSSSKVSVAPLIAFGGAFWINTIVDYFLGRQGDLLMLAALTDDASAASLYDVAYSLSQLALMAMTVGLGGVAFATFARLAVESSETFDRFYSFLVRIMSLLTIPLFAFLLFNADSVLNVVYSHRYAGAMLLVQGMMLFRILSRLFAGPENAEYLLSNGQVWIVVVIGLVGASMNLVGNVLLIPRFGAVGVVVASGVANLIVNFLGARSVFRISQTGLQVSYWMKLTLVGCVASFCVSVIDLPWDILTLAVRIAACALLVTGGLILLKPLYAEDLDWLSRIDARLRRPLALFVRMSK
ncbi:MAG: oligosaccharide flippase family protein [Bacteroidota bacterium]